MRFIKYLRKTNSSNKAMQIRTRESQSNKAILLLRKLSIINLIMHECLSDRYFVDLDMCQIAFGA